MSRNLLFSRNILRSWLVPAVMLWSLDQVSKWWIMSTGMPYLLNTGGVWGVGQQWYYANFFWFGGALIICIFLYRSALQERENEVRLLALGLLCGGALSNAVDRLTHGGVVDWIVAFNWFPWFNLADVAINFGIFLFLFHYYFAKK